MIKIHSVILLFVSAIFVGCSLPSRDLINAWEKSDLNNLTIDLISKTEVQWMSFGTDGYVSVTSGKVGGALCSPLCTWEMNADGSLTIDYGDGQSFDKIRKISLNSKWLIAEVNGEVKKYKRLK